MHNQPAHHSPQRRSAAAYRQKQMPIIRAMHKKVKELREKQAEAHHIESAKVMRDAHLKATRQIHRALAGVKKHAPQK